MKLVTHPIKSVQTMALGTTVSGLLHSSHKWTAPSRPAYMKFADIKPLMKLTPSGQPLSFTKVVQTALLDCFGEAIARQVTTMVKNPTNVSITENRCQLYSNPRECIKESNVESNSQATSLIHSVLFNVKMLCTHDRMFIAWKIRK